MGHGSPELLGTRHQSLSHLMPPFVPSYGPYFSLNSPTIRRKIVLSDEKMVDLK